MITRDRHSIDLERYGIVDIRDSSSVELWCAALRVSTKELVEAVNIVGTSGDAVSKYIRASRAAPSRM
jgi:hypothetical protein